MLRTFRLAWLDSLVLVRQRVPAYLHRTRAELQQANDEADIATSENPVIEIPLGAAVTPTSPEPAYVPKEVVPEKPPTPEPVYDLDIANLNPHY